MAIGTTTLLLGGLVLGAIGVGLGTYGAFAQAQAQQDMANYNKAVAKQQAAAAERNAKLAQRQAEQAAIAKENDTRRQAQLEKRKLLRIKAMNTAKSGYSGTAVAGSNLLAEIETAQNVELNFQEIMRSGKEEAANIRYQGKMSAYNSLLGAMSSRARANSYAMQARNAAKTKWTKSGSTLLKGASSLALKGASA